MIVPLVGQLAVVTSIATACALLGRARASHYRAQKDATGRARLPFEPEPRHEQPARPTERTQRRQAAAGAGGVDRAPLRGQGGGADGATLLDEGTYLCSMSTLHRILRVHDLAGERRRQATHPPRKKPERLATKPGQVWSWDITKLRSPTRGVYYDLYVVIDIYKLLDRGESLLHTVGRDHRIRLSDLIVRETAPARSP